MSNLGGRIKFIREQLGLNQAAFASRIGLKSAVAVSQYESNQREPDISKLRMISKLCNVSLDWLLIGSRALNPELEALGNRLKEVREYLLPVKFEKTELAEMLGIKLQEYIDYEDGVKEVDEDILIKHKELFNINPDWIKHGATESNPRPKYILVDNGNLDVDLIELLYPLKSQGKRIESLIFTIDDKDFEGHTLLVLIEDRIKYHILKREFSIFGGTGLTQIKRGIYFLYDFGIPIALYKIDKEVFNEMRHGQLPIRLATAGMDPYNPFREYGLSTKSIRKDQSKYKLYVLSENKDSEEYKEAIRWKKDIIKELIESQKRHKERAKNKLIYYPNPRLEAVVEKVKDICHTGTDEQIKIIEGVVQSIWANVDAKILPIRKKRN